MLDDQVWVDVLKYEIPNEHVEMMKYHHRELDIADYKYAPVMENSTNSAWLLRFFETVEFIGLVMQDSE